MDGYTRVFNHAIEKYNETENKDILFQTFRRNYAVYGFLDNGDQPPDIEADMIARKTDMDMYREYKEVLRFRKSVGYGDISPLYADYSNLDSRHIMMMVVLFSNVKDRIDRVVEIGGGFGNWRTLNQHIPEWTIIDLPHVLELQKWYFTQQEIAPSRYQLISGFDYDAWARENTSHDLVIGTHSLSEFSLDVFHAYFEKVVRNSKYFFYAYHNTRPTPELIESKLLIIHQHFDLVINVSSEQGNVSNCLFIRKTNSDEV